MIKPLRALNFTQFLSAFADNMIILVAIAIIHDQHMPLKYIGFVQAAFLVAYIVLAPVVGTFAERNPKSKVLLLGNLLKALSVVCFLAGLHPVLSYAVTGIACAFYGPAKYGILPDLTNSEEELLKANAKLEGYTIVAILAGTLAGGLSVNSFGIATSLCICLGLYLVSFAVTFAIPRFEGNRRLHYAREAARFFTVDCGTLFRHPVTRFALIGTGAFWMAAVVLRTAAFAWIPLAYSSFLIAGKEETQISMIIASTAIGIMIGALSAPYLVSARNYFRSYWFGLLMIPILLAFPYVHNLYVTVVFLLVVGFFGGVFVVPMNSVLQDRGKPMIGTGKVIAVQNFVENSLMAVGTGLYVLTTSIVPGWVGADSSGANLDFISYAIFGMGLILAGFVAVLRWHVPRLRNEGKQTDSSL
ncbi:lysophospholipid transporter LplT [Brevibacillus sp. B_LB10_24]|uniref:lysophospholipid transporter LplT n=1 Tax=Brevibacillus sp. B_LB10_24 TaxID=3380645 RepID=UPI0038BE1E1F